MQQFKLLVNSRRVSKQNVFEKDTHVKMTHRDSLVCFALINSANMDKHDECLPTSPSLLQRMEWFFLKQTNKNWIKPQRKVQVSIPKIMQKKSTSISNF